jgi:hypothetical protein
MTSKEVAGIDRLVKSDIKEMCRLTETSTGDIVEHPLSSMPMYVHKNKVEIKLIRIVYYSGNVEIRWNDCSTFRYGLNCQMWVLKKILFNY